MTDYAKRASGLVVPRPIGLIRPGKLSAKGRYHVAHVRDGCVIDEDDVTNLIVNQGLDHILGVEFTGIAQVTAWFLALFANNYVPVASDTAATIVGNAGETTSYNGNARPAFQAVEGGQGVTNGANPANFTFSAAVTVYGAFLASTSQQSSTQGVLFSAAQFNAPKQVVANDQLLLTYSFSAASA